MTSRYRPGGLRDTHRMECSEYDMRLIRLHCDYLRRTGATAQTLHHRRANLRRLAERLPVDLIATTPEHLDTWQAGLTCSLSSMNTYGSHVRSFYRWAVDSGLIEHDPTLRLPRPKRPPRSARPVPEDDLNVAIECAPEPIRTWLVLGAFMGLRAAEVAHIRREDVTELEIGGRRRMFLSGIGKGGKPFKLPVPAEVRPYLEAHLSGRPGPLWHTRLGNPVRPAYVSDKVSGFFRSIGMPFTMHWTRHSFGTAFHRQTRDLLMTMSAMRHSNPNTTKIYVEQVQSEAMAEMDKLSTRLAAKRAAKAKSSDRPPPNRRRGTAA